MLYTVKKPNQRFITRHDLYSTLASAKKKANKVQGAVWQSGEIIYQA